MSVRLRCNSCRAAFLTNDDPAAVRVACPKCGARQGLVNASGSSTAGPASVYVPSDSARGKSTRRKVMTALALLSVLASVGVGVAVAWPSVMRWWKPVPPDPVEYVARNYLQSLIDKDKEASAKLGTVDLPPAVRSFRDVKRDSRYNRRLKGTFGPVSAFHQWVADEYDYDESSGRYTSKHALGVAAETLDALHAAKEKNEQEGLARKIASGDPEDLFDAAESLGKTFASLAETTLAPKKILPTYEMLVDQARPQLPPAEKTLVLDYAADRPTWAALLGRPFVTLKTDGPFIYDRAEVSAVVRDALGSSGDAPTTLRLVLTRFRLEGIDTGWRVTSARRQAAADLTPPTSPVKADAPAPKRAFSTEK